MDLFLATMPDSVVLLVFWVLQSCFGNYRADELKFTQYVECQHHSTSSIFKQLCSHTADGICSLWEISRLVLSNSYPAAKELQKLYDIIDYKKLSLCKIKD